MTTTETESAVVTGGEILAAVRAAGVTAPAYVEQTGGGTATVYVGEPDDDTGWYPVAIGPGSFNWGDANGSEFGAAELFVGPDEPDAGGSYADEALDADALLAWVGAEVLAWYAHTCDADCKH